MKEGPPDLTRTKPAKITGFFPAGSRIAPTNDCVLRNGPELLLICVYGHGQIVFSMAGHFWENCRPTSDKCLIPLQVRFHCNRPSYLAILFSCRCNVLRKKEREKERRKERKRKDRWTIRVKSRKFAKIPGEQPHFRENYSKPDLCSPLVGFTPTKQRCYLFY